MGSVRFPLLDRITGKLSKSYLPDLSGDYVPQPATGTPSSSTYLRGDGAWAVPPGGGGTDLTAVDHGDGTGVLTSSSGVVADHGDGTGVLTL